MGTIIKYKNFYTLQYTLQFWKILFYTRLFWLTSRVKTNKTARVVINIAHTKRHGSTLNSEYIDLIKKCTSSQEVTRVISYNVMQIWILYKCTLYLMRSILYLSKFHIITDQL